MKFWVMVVFLKLKLSEFAGYSGLYVSRKLYNVLMWYFSEPPYTPLDARGGDTTLGNI